MFIRINEHEIVNVPDDQIKSIVVHDGHLIIKHRSQSIDDWQIAVNLPKTTCEKPSEVIDRVSYALAHGSRIIDIS